MREHFLLRGWLTSAILLAMSILVVMCSQFLYLLQKYKKGWIIRHKLQN